MEGRVFSDQEQLLQFLRRLKEVFDVCDEDADGFIRVEHLEHLGLQFGQGDEVKARLPAKPVCASVVWLTSSDVSLFPFLNSNMRTSGTWWA